MGSLSLSHWIVVLVIVLIFFGKDRIPGLMKDMGKGIRGFREGLKGEDDDKDGDDSKRVPPPGA